MHNFYLQKCPNIPNTYYSQVDSTNFTLAILTNFGRKI